MERAWARNRHRVAGKDGELPVEPSEIADGVEERLAVVSGSVLLAMRGCLFVREDKAV